MENNQITFHHKKGSAAKIEMTVTESMLTQFIELFDIELELLQGQHVQLDNGMFKCSLEVEGYKRDMFEDFLRSLASLPSMEVTMMGLPVNKN